MNRMFGVTARAAAWLFMVLFPILAQEGPYRSPKQEGKGPLKVFILAGQSNMQGQGTVTAKDPAGNEWNRGIFGPELQFGHLVGNYYSHQVLIIKTAWGGKSLKTDYRPPSSGGTVGPYYTLMIETVTRVLSDIKKEFPAYDGSGYELAGFGWWHGWNDGCENGAVEEYEQNLTNFIKDLRKDLKAPQLPIVIAEFTGMSNQNNDPHWSGLSKAQSATAQRPEFKSTTKFVPTREFQRDEKDSPGGGGHHEWNNSDGFKRVNAAAIQGLLSGCQTIIQRYPATSAARKAEEVLGRYR
jgi:hypothetical protein